MVPIETLTIFSGNPPAVETVIERVIPSLMTKYSGALMWRTEGYKIEGGRIQKYNRERKKLIDNKNYSELLNKETKNGIYCSIYEIKKPVKLSGLEILSQYAQSALIFCDIGEINYIELWSILAIFDAGLKPEAVDTVMSYSNSAVFCRYYVDECTHAAWQFIGAPQTIENIASLAEISQLKEASSQDEIAAAIGDQ